MEYRKGTMITDQGEEICIFNKSPSIGSGWDLDPSFRDGDYLWLEVGGKL